MTFNCFPHPKACCESLSTLPAESLPAGGQPAASSWGKLEYQVLREIDEVQDQVWKEKGDEAKVIHGLTAGRGQGQMRNDEDRASQGGRQAQAVEGYYCT